MVLTTAQERQAPEEARNLLMRSQQEQLPGTSRAMIEMIITIMVYKFTNLSRREVEAMLGITLGQTRVYQEAKAEGREEEARSLILRLLTRRVGELPLSVRSQIDALSLLQLESLGEALLDFSGLSNLETWLIDRGQQSTEPS